MHSTEARPLNLSSTAACQFAPLTLPRSKDLSCASAAANAIRNLSSFAAGSFCTPALVEKLTTRLQACFASLDLRAM